MIDERLARERDFHNDRFGAEVDLRAGLGKWYAAAENANAMLDTYVLDHSVGRDVLEYGCADGGYSMDVLGLDRLAHRLYGIDISDAAIAKADSRARSRGSGNTSFAVMNAEEMTFPDETFDLVFGRGILHHLDTLKSLRELHRVLRPKGTVVLFEPMGHNPLINWYRARTPQMRTADEHPLRDSDFAMARGLFQRVDARYFGLATLAAVPLQPTPLGRPAMRLCEAFDSAVLRIPFIGRHGWIVVLTLGK